MRRCEISRTKLCKKFAPLYDTSSVGFAATFSHRRRQDPQSEPYYAPTRPRSRHCVSHSVFECVRRVILSEAKRNRTRSAPSKAKVESRRTPLRMTRTYRALSRTIRRGRRPLSREPRTLIHLYEPYSILTRVKHPKNPIRQKLSLSFLQYILKNSCFIHSLFIII